MAKKKVAIVEDDLAISQMYRLKFEAEGYDVAVAENGQVGLEVIEGFRPDVVLLDMMMPQMNGDEVLKNMRSHDWGKDTPVLILTNMGKEEASRSLESLNVHSYIVKAEMTPKQVAERVRVVLGG
ncbi:MAG TPA: response regulator [Candidatus Saccharimonadales bacterium]|jgi:DNA-binding response OmpR family regulator